MLLLILYVVAVVAMFAVTVRSRPDGRAVVLRARLRPPRAAHAAGSRLRRRRTAGRAGRAGAAGAADTAGAAGAADTAGTAGAAEPSGAAGPERAVRPENPASLEGMLTVLLLGGEITRSQYRRAVEEIAAQDEAGHPLPLPPDPGPSAH